MLGRHSAEGRDQTIDRGRYLLVNGLEELALVLSDAGVVHLPHELRVLIDEPGLPENVSGCVLHLVVRMQDTKHYNVV